MPAPSSLAARTGSGADGRIVVGISQEPDTLFAPLAGVPAQAVVHLALSQGLTVRDEAGLLQPRLAERTPTLENGGAVVTKDAQGRDVLAVSYRIRAGAKFSSGEAVTADDARFSWELALDPALPVVARSTALLYERIETPDPRTVTVVYRPGILDPSYNAFCCTVVPRRAYENAPRATLKESPLGRAPVFAGPYRLREWIAGSSITVEALDDFWLGKPKAKTLVFRFFADPGAALAALRAGEVDVVTKDALGLDQLAAADQLQADTRLAVRVTPAQTWEHLDFNLRDPRDLVRPHPILGDRAVRQALARALDRDLLARRVDPRVARVDSFLFGASWAAAPPGEIAVYDRDPATARRMLDAAGWVPSDDGVREKAGRSLELRLGTTEGSRVREATARAIAEQLRDVGVRVTVELVPAQRWFASRGEGPLAAGTFDLALFAWVQGDDPRTFIYNCDQIPAKENGFAGQNYAGYCSREFDAAMATANGALRQAERLPGYLRAQRIWTVDLPVVPLYRHVNLEAARRDLRGFRPSAADLPVTANVWEWELAVP